MKNRFNGKYESIYPSDRIRFSNENLWCDKEDPHAEFDIKTGSIIDNRDRRVVYNKSYKSANPLNDNEPYHAFKAYTISRAGRKTDKMVIWVQFNLNRVCVTCTRNQFLSRQVYDPYFPGIFGVASIGNIIVDVHRRPHNDWYTTWLEIISRCYNPNNKEYQYFGGIGVTPLNPKWLCYEWFYQDNLDLVEAGFNAMENPNDPWFYQWPASITRGYLLDKTIRGCLSQYPINTQTYSDKVLNTPIWKREKYVVPHPGRKSKPKLKELCTIVNRVEENSVGTIYDSGNVNIITPYK